MFMAAGWVGCASDQAPEAAEPDSRRRIDQILSPQGSKPNEAYSKRSRYDGQDYNSKSLKSKVFRVGQGPAREGGKDFKTVGGEGAKLMSQRSGFESEAAREGGQSARTFASRFGDKVARTGEFSGGREVYRTEGAREADDRFYSGQPRDYEARRLGADQLSPTARETARLYPANAAAPLNEEDVRRVLNKGPRER